MNRTPQMMIATIHGDLPVKKGQKLAGTRIIPLVIEQEKMDAMQAAAGSEPILNVLPMQAKKFAVITTGSEVFKGRIEDKFTPILVGKLAEYGCEMTFHKSATTTRRASPPPFWKRKKRAVSSSSPPAA